MTDDARPVTPGELRAAFAALVVLGQAIRELGSVPAGVLYANVMPVMSHAAFESAIDLLVRTKVVSRVNNVITWIAPEEK